ncbi:hypothetical protein [Frankia sp. AgW1.1]|uniref:hypothetical protein n=1 Tax=Frankia sp. AgW1.1 TaxID=1836971 RepID=UPI00193342D0|nr:hypothetical protein [Frankia sp. AgW1.1]MBL7494379.1 hypothetical protein [Frankia sp. AgW1.1]
MADELRSVSLYDLHVWSGRLLDAGANPDAVIVFNSDGRDIDTVALNAGADDNPRAKLGFYNGEWFSPERLGYEGEVPALCLTLTV